MNNGWANESWLWTPALSVGVKAINALLKYVSNSS